MQFALGIVTALVSRAQTGKGQRVQTSALGAQLWLQMWELSHVWMTGELLERSGPHHANMPGPYGFYETASGDHFLFAAAQTNEAWDAFWIFVDDPMESINSKWDQPIKRLGQGVTSQDAAEIRNKMAAGFKSKTTPEWSEFLAGQPDIVYEKVQNYDEVRVDAQALANDYIESVEIEHVGETSIVGNLMTFSETPSSTRGGPSDLGADTETTLAALGFSADEIKSVVDHADAERAIAKEELGD